MSIKTLNKEMGLTVPVFSLYHAMLLWLLPIGIVAGCIQGFNSMHFISITAGLVHAILAIYMLLRNTLLHNIIQLFLSGAFSLLTLYFVSISTVNGKLPQFGMFNVSVESFSLLLFFIITFIFLFKKK